MSAKSETKSMSPQLAWYYRNKEVAKARGLAYRENNREKHLNNSRVRAKKYRDQDPEKARIAQTCSNYGIDVKEARRLRSIVHCECCSREMTGGQGRLARHVDHCHTTGKVRGAICNDCNAILGRADDDSERLQQAINYLNKHRSIE